MWPSNFSLFQILQQQYWTFLFASFLVSVLCLFFDDSFSKVSFSNYRNGAVTILRAIQKKSNNPIYKTQNMKQKVKSNNFWYRKVRRAITISLILLLQYWKMTFFKGYQKLFLLLGATLIFLPTINIKNFLII